MVCNRCIMAVGKILQDLGLKPLRIELGTAVVEGSLDADTKDQLRARLEEYGFALIDDRRSRTVERICTAVIELVQSSQTQIPGKVNLSEYLSSRCHSDYSSLSKLFSSVKGMSIERYYIVQRIEKVKELLAYGEMSVSEIADSMGFSSPAHLSSQFKGVTGLTPREFKALKVKPLIPLDKV